MELGDLNGDGYVDAFVGRSREGANNSQTYPSVVFLNDGTGAFVDTGQMLIANPDDPTNNNFKTRDVKLGDVDNDGDLDAFLGSSQLRYGGLSERWLGHVLRFRTATRHRYGQLFRCTW